MIVSFGDKATEDLYHGRMTNRVRKLPKDVFNGALIKMDMIEAASKLVDLKAPPGNQLEALKGDLRGYHSIRVNLQWRLVFVWRDNGVHGVRLLDYHRG